MSRVLAVAAALVGTLALSASAAAVPPYGACKHHACGSLGAEEAFGSYVFRHLALQNPGAVISCQPVRHRRRHYHCADRAARKGRLSSCVVRGTVVEVGQGAYRFRSIKVAPSCPKREASK